MTIAVVFAYHDIGVRCLEVLLGRGIRVPLVVTHEDDPSENIWFDSVAKLAAAHGIPVVTPKNPNTGELLQWITGLRPDFIFSFYYRHVLGRPLLDATRLGALNMHGSLLPRYRGRSPVNWAIINGERETGVTLHYMVEKADAGDIVYSQRVPILPDDTALDVFRKVTRAAEAVLDCSLQRLIDGTALRVAQNHSEASYFGRRRPADGRINWKQPATAVHNLVRSVAPPYPGAFTSIGGRPARVLRTLRNQMAIGPFDQPSLFFDNGRCYAQCGDAALLRILQIEMDGWLLQDEDLRGAFGGRAVPLLDTVWEHT